MHELGIANSVFEAVCAEAKHRPGARILKVGMCVGELSGVDPSALSFCFEAIVKDTSFEPLPLEIEFCPRRHRCPGCGHLFPVADFEMACPQCGEQSTECVSGTELELSYLELEES